MGIFDHFGALMGGPGITAARQGLPGCGYGVAAGWVWVRIQDHCSMILPLIFEDDILILGAKLIPLIAA